jgi:hypothetical protein
MCKHRLERYSLAVSWEAQRSNLGLLARASADRRLRNITEAKLHSNNNSSHLLFEVYTRCSA